MNEAHFSDRIGQGSSHVAVWFYTRHNGLTLVLVHGLMDWTATTVCDAVVDDFGNLVKVA